eukprot:gene503-2980_t
MFNFVEHLPAEEAASWELASLCDALESIINACAGRLPAAECSEALVRVVRECGALNAREGALRCLCSIATHDEHIPVLLDAGAVAAAEPLTGAEDADLATAARGVVACIEAPAAGCVRERLWRTAGLPAAAARSGAVQWEVTLSRCGGEAQVGWAAGGAALAGLWGTGLGYGRGAGDVARSWAADGLRDLLFAEGEEEEWGAAGRWREGDTVGAAADLDRGELLYCCPRSGEWTVVFTGVRPAEG